MVRVLDLKRLYKLSDEQMEYQLLDRMSCQRLCLLEDAKRLAMLLRKGVGPFYKHASVGAGRLNGAPRQRSANNAWHWAIKSPVGDLYPRPCVRRQRVKACLDQPVFASGMPLDPVPMKSRVLRCFRRCFENTGR